MQENYENIEVDISDDCFLKLAKKAHERNITFNDLAIEIIQNYINGKVSINLEDKLIETTKNIILNGITQETLSDFGYSFSEWFDESNGSKTCKELIQMGFDQADLVNTTPF